MQPTEINGLPGLWIERPELAEKWAGGRMLVCPQCGLDPAGFIWAGSMRCEGCGGVGIEWGSKPRWFSQHKETHDAT